MSPLSRPMRSGRRARRNGADDDSGGVERQIHILRQRRRQQLHFRAGKAGYCRNLGGLVGADGGRRRDIDRHFRRLAAAHIGQLGPGPERLVAKRKSKPCGASTSMPSILTMASPGLRPAARRRLVRRHFGDQRAMRRIDAEAVGDVGGDLLQPRPEPTGGRSARLSRRPPPRSWPYWRGWRSRCRPSRPSG